MKNSRRSSLKRTFAFISALSMIGSFSQTIGAAAALSNVMSASAADEDDTDNSEKYSRIDIEISNQMDFGEEVPCTVNVLKVSADGSEDSVFEDAATVGGEKDSKATFSTGGIANGKYVVEIHAPGYETFRQEIDEFDNMVCTVSVTLGFQKGYTYADVYRTDADGKVVLKADGTPVIETPKSDNHPGVMTFGDVNGDGKIDGRDEELLLAAINYSIKNHGDVNIELKEGETLISDLNHDGKTNLADLTFFTRGYVETEKWETHANVTKELSEKYKLAALAKTETVGDTIGNNVTMADLLNSSSTEDGEEQKLTLELPEMVQAVDEEGNLMYDENGDPVMEEGKISEKHPVGVALELNDTPVKEMSFGTNADRGFIEVEIGDEVIKVPFDVEDSENGEEKPLAADEDELSEEERQLIENATEESEIESETESPADEEVHENLAKESKVKVSIDENGNIKVDMGEQIAVKKITLKITKVKNTNLAEIGTVEFLNGMEERLAEPAIDYPLNVKVVQVKAEDKYATIMATWDPCVNIEGYEFEVSTSSATKADGSFTSTIPGVQNTQVVPPTFTLASEHGNFKLIKINTTYYVHARTIAGDYKSAWSDIAKVTTESMNKPDKPDYVTAKGGFKSMTVTWGADKTNSTKGYKLYYKNIGVDEEKNPIETEYKEVNVGKATSYQLTELADEAEYDVYVVGYNDKGSSPESVHSMTKTTSSKPVQMIKYNVINCDDEGNVGSAHIVSVTRNGGDMTGNYNDNARKEQRQNAANATYKNNAEKNAALNNLPLTAWGVVDGDQSSYYAKQTWDDGGFNAIGGNGIYFEFDDEYEIGSVAVSKPYGVTNYFYTRLKYWDAAGKEYNVGSFCGASKKTDKNGNEYYIINFPKAVNAKKIQIGFGNYWWDQTLIAVSEIYFYAYDSSMDDIMALYVDDLHTVLRDDVTQETIDELRERITSPDKKTGEYHPNKAALERELATAEKILNAKQLSQPVFINNSITTYDPIEKGSSRRYSGLNAWQPLGVSAGANTEVTVYVGSPSYKSGENTELKLIATQYNSESDSVVLSTTDLKIGANTITIPSGKISQAEAGGALYIDNRSGDQSKVLYSVRVDGGTEVPKLDLYKVTDREERLNRAADYIEALEKHVKNMEAEHNEVHKNAVCVDSTGNVSPNTRLNYDYNKTLCIAGATDILCDTMMYSIPAHQVLAGLGNGTVEERAEKLVQSMNSMEEMMKLFYQHKGMSADAANVVDRIPNRHLNIRYQRMFQGAFMYAASNHIGIQWGSTSSMVNCNGVKADKDGRYVSGSYFGWGIAHEIGHCLNDSSYVEAEITNNYFSLLSQSQDKNAGSRLNYNNIFKKVTSNTKGKADQGTQLGMYWQLHLAYDNDFNFKTYDTSKDIFDSLFYARMDTYSRTPSKAPKPYGTALTLNGGTDQQLMRLACAAAEKDVLEFFERWGKTPDATTRAYASQFEKETRAIMYANDDSRVYAMEGESWLVNDDGSAASVIDDVKVSVGTGTKANKVTLSIDVSEDMYADDILGYEIIRCTISNGDVKETPVGFTSSPKFTDTVTSLNNRTVSYKVTLIDHYLNRSEVFVTEMVKIQHDGSIDKSNWTITTENGNRYFTAPNIIHEASEDELPCDHTVINPVIAAFDDNTETVYEAKVTGDPSIYINFNQPLVVCGLKYTSGTASTDPIGYYIYVKNEAVKGGWQHVATGSFNGSGVAYFANADKKYISTYETTEIRLQFTNQAGKNISISEIDVLGVTGDNVDFRKDGEKATAAFGLLSEDYKYGTREQDFIPEGSLVFTGSYKGNPAYNAVILFDENGNIVGGTGVDDEGEAQQIILADVPDGSLITEVSNGTWVYWINPEDIENMYWPEKVRVELYRVNNALTNEGQRMVSDSLFETLAAKDEMPSITLGGNRKYTTEAATESSVTE